MVEDERRAQSGQRCKNAACMEDDVWYNFTIYHPEDPQHISEGIKSVVLYTRINTSIVCNHVISMHPREHKAFTGLYNRKMWHERKEVFMG